MKRSLKLKTYPDEDHLRETVHWVCRAQDATGYGGVSGVYSTIRGWAPPDPLSTGQIIPTILRCASSSGSRDLNERAALMGEWEVSAQLPCGGVRKSMGSEKEPLVFNTGQAILGWTELYKALKAERFLNSAKVAADWLVDIQDNDGKWARYTYDNLPHTHDSQTAHALFELGHITGNKKYMNAATKNVAWILPERKDNGYFAHMGHKTCEAPNTVMIGYTFNGLTRCLSYLGDGGMKKAVMDSVLKGVEAIMLRYELKKKHHSSIPMYLPATLNEAWRSKDTYSCLAGNAQIAILFFELFLLNKDGRLLNAGLKLNDQIKATQRLYCLNDGIRGGVPGSFPVWGKYFRFSYPSLSAKFIIDSIMIQESIMKDFGGS